MPNINPYSTYKMALLCVLCILQDAQFISAGANSGHNASKNRISTGWFVIRREEAVLQQRGNVCRQVHLQSK